MSDEDRLRNRLHRQAAEVPIVSDLDDVAARFNRRRRRPDRARPFAVAAVGLLVVGGLIVVVAERAGHDGPRAVSVAGPNDASDAADAPTTLVPGDPQNGPTDPISEGFSSGVPTGPTGAPSMSPQGGTGVPIPQGGPVTTIPPKGQFLVLPAPVLPAPGAEQPADPEAARQAVSQAVVDATDGAASNETHAKAIEGGEIWLPAFRQLRSGQFGPQVNSAKTVVLGVVFLTPTRATVEFRSDLGTGGTSGPYVGDVIFNEHGWQMSREFYCRLIGPAGVTCP